MLAQQKTLIILAVLLLAPISAAVDFNPGEDVDIRSKAASNWHSIEPVETTASALKSLDYHIHLAIASSIHCTMISPNPGLMIHKIIEAREWQLYN